DYVGEAAFGVDCLRRGSVVQEIDPFHFLVLPPRYFDSLRSGDRTVYAASRQKSEKHSTEVLGFQARADVYGSALAEFVRSDGRFSFVVAPRIGGKDLGLFGFQNIRPDLALCIRPAQRT